MNKYEVMFIVRATMESSQVKSTADSMKKVIESAGSKVVEFKELGEKKLAYPINKEINGYYYVMTIEATKEAEAELNRRANLDENVIRHLIIRLDEE